MSDLDTALGFSIPSRHARGRLARIGPVLEQVLSAHGYPPVIESLLAEALTLTALLGALLKGGNGQLTMQAQTGGGPVELLVCDYRDGELRGYVRHDSEGIQALGVQPGLKALFGEGYLAITFDQAASNERYQGIVPIEGEHLCAAVEHYFAQSEQVPSLIRFAMEGDVAGGLLLQHLPEGEEGRERLHVRQDHPDWEHVRILGETVEPAELANPELALEELLWRLFSEAGEIRAHDRIAISRGCRCSLEHIRAVLSRFSDEDRAEMKDPGGAITVDCAFCAKSFVIPATNP